MEDAAVQEAEVSGAAEFAPALVATHLFGHSVSIARPPPAHRLDESYPPLEFTAGESSCSSGQAPMTDAPPEGLAPAPIQVAAKKKKEKRVIMPQSLLDSLMAAEEWQSVPLLDEEWLKVMTALIPDVEQFFACRGLSLEKY
jgi:hypothetical protein